MSPLKAVIAEDEPVLRDELRETLAKLWPDLVICAEAGDGIEALRALEEHAPDILFLDIQMPGMSGIEVAQQASGKAHVAFVTAYDSFAIAAFEQGAVDYVMKPISPARIATTVARLKQRLKGAPASLDGILKTLAKAAAPKQYLRWITASKGDELQLVTIDEICYFVQDGSGATAITAESAALVGKSIAELAAELDPAQFVPADTSTLVNVSAIAGVARDAAGRLQVALKRRFETLGVDDAYASLVAKVAGMDVDTPDDNRLLATVLFTDIVDSTATASGMGDRAWRHVLLEHDRICRKAIERFHGRLIKSTGDGVFATFDGPARAVRCASAIGESVRGLGLAIRAGVHTGECELHDDDVRGIAVHIGARIVALAGPGEVLVSGTVRDLVGGSGIEFEDRGVHTLKGVAAPVRILAVASTRPARGAEIR
jgi:DNA-binding LytR/AlgR family response regulator